MSKVYKMFSKITGFDWDEGNLLKNWEKHAVSHLEAEQVFFNEPLIVFEDLKHSLEESRWYVLGRTDESRKLMIVFTIRGDKIRVISSRDMSRKERRIYEKEI
jgi:uncharacterized DUF497 family protein